MLFEIIFGIAALIVIAIGVAVYLRIMRREAEADALWKAEGRSDSRRRQRGQTTSELGLGCGVVVFIGLAVVGVLSVHPVDAGFVGVVTSGGEVQKDTLKPGWNFLPPFLYGVTNVDTRVHGIPFGQDPAARFGAASSEYQDVFLQGTLNIHVDQNAAVDLYQKVGLDYDQKLVIPFFTTAIKEVVPQYKIGDILANREQIRHQTVEKLQAKLLPYGIIVDDVAISNIDFSPEYKAAVEAKQVAQQQVQTEIQITQQRIQQAQQQIETAKGNAQAAIENAKGTAEANRLLTASLSTLLIQYETIRKLNPNVQVIYLPETGNFLLQVPQPAAAATP